MFCRSSASNRLSSTKAVQMWTKIGRNAWKQSSVGTTTTGQTLIRSCKARLLKASRFFSHFLTTIRLSSGCFELYEPGAAPIRGKRALPPIRDLLEQGKIVALDF